MEENNDSLSWQAILFLISFVVIVICAFLVGRYWFPKLSDNTFVSNFSTQQKAIEKCDLKGCELICFDFFASWGKNFAECTDNCQKAYDIFCK